MLLGPWSRSKSKADIAIDFGSASTIIFEQHSGMVFNEPTLCAFSGDASNPELRAIGHEAKAMVDRTARNLKLKRPVKRGMIDDIQAGSDLLRHAVHKSLGRHRGRRLRAIVGLATGTTQIERQALYNTVREAGVIHPHFVPATLAAAVGSGLAVEEPRGRMVIDWGSGLTEIAVLSLGGICVARSIRLGGDSLDAAVQDHLTSHHRFQIGRATAERFKLQLSEMRRAGASADSITISGRDMVSGLPCQRSFEIDEFENLIARHIIEIIDELRLALAVTPPELSRDILDDGITLVGGTALMPMVAAAIEHATGLQTRVVADPLNAVASGLGSLLTRH